METTRRAVVIGTGAGGLSAAAHLAKQGFDVVACEQSENLGGYLAPFFRQGYQFNPGVHYIGECGPDQRMGRLLSELGIDTRKLFCRLDPDGFDIYRFGDFEMKNCQGLTRYRERLAAAFPAETGALARFFRRLERMRDAMTAIAAAQGHALRLEHVDGLRALPQFWRWSSSTYGELLGAAFRDPKLRAVLAAAGGDYGLPPSRASALAGMGLLVHYGDGASFPRGGSAALRDALVAAAEAHGARFRTRARVEKILTRGDRAIGVELANGERIEADVVVSDADPVITFGRLVDAASILPAKLREKVRHTEPSLATFSVQLGMRRELRAHGFRAANVWSYPDWDIEAAYPQNGALPRRPAIFVSPNSLKDDSGVMAPPGCTALEVVTFAPYARFARWSDLPVGGRGAEYEAEKARVVDWLLGAVEERFPGLIGDVEVCEASTPLTNQSYVMAVEGAAYGPAHTPQQMGRHRFGPTTPIPNLFLAGAGVWSCGVSACLGSGRLAAQLGSRAVARARRASLPPLARLRETAAGRFAR